MRLGDRVLMVVCGIGVWGLLAVTLGSSSAQAETQELSRRDVERIVEGCGVTGQVYMYSEDYGQIQNARINC